MTQPELSKSLAIETLAHWLISDMQDYITNSNEGVPKIGSTTRLKQYLNSLINNYIRI